VVKPLIDPAVKGDGKVAQAPAAAGQSQIAASQTPASLSSAR